MQMGKRVCTEQASLLPRVAEAAGVSHSQPAEERLLGPATHSRWRRGCWGQPPTAGGGEVVGGQLDCPESHHQSLSLSFLAVLTGVGSGAVLLGCKAHFVSSPA